MPLTIFISCVKLKLAMNFIHIPNSRVVFLPFKCE